MLAFCNFPAEHWRQIQSTIPIQSMFVTVRLRTKHTKGYSSVDPSIAMTLKLLIDAKKTWRNLNGHTRLADVIDIKVKFVDGLKMAA